MKRIRIWPKSSGSGDNMGEMFGTGRNQSCLGISKLCLPLRTSKVPPSKILDFDLRQCFVVLSVQRVRFLKVTRNSVKTLCAVTLAMIAGFGLGILAGQPLAQILPPPAYVVTLFDSGLKSVMDTDYPSLNPATFQPYGGRYIIHFSKTVSSPESICGHRVRQHGKCTGVAFVRRL